MHAGIISSGLSVSTNCTVHKTMSIKDKMLYQGVIEMYPQHYYQEDWHTGNLVHHVPMGYFVIKLLCKSTKYS